MEYGNWGQKCYPILANSYWDDNFSSLSQVRSDMDGEDCKQTEVFISGIVPPQQKFGIGRSLLQVLQGKRCGSRGRIFAEFVTVAQRCGGWPQEVIWFCHSVMWCWLIFGLGTFYLIPLLIFLGLKTKVRDMASEDITDLAGTFRVVKSECA